MMSNQKNLHIVSFNIPFPPNYGGVIDVFYKLKALYALGVQVHLHCFEYNRSPSKELEQYCKTVHYYKRHKSFKYWFSKIPFIVLTRSNIKLLKNLLLDNYPVLFEGLHTCYFLNDLAINGDRKIIVRVHNIEHEYYMHLAQKESNVFKKIYYVTESYKLRKYEGILKNSTAIAAITEKDRNYFQKVHQNSIHIPAFHPFQDLKIKEGKGDYILYHGDLSVNENIEAAEFIIKKISSKITHNIILAGRNPKKQLINLAKRAKNIQVIANPSNEQMDRLLADAQINLLLTWQATGIKLKLINSLFSGRYCIVNDQMIKGTGLDDLCLVNNTSQEIIDEINMQMNTYFSKDEINKRKEILLKIVNNKESAQNLINLLD